MKNTSDNEGKNNKKSFKKEERPFQKFEKSAKPRKSTFGDKREEGFKKPFDKERRPFQKDSGSEDRPFKKSYSDKKEGGFKKPYDKERKPFQKDAGSEDRPFKKSYSDRKEGGFKKPYDKERKPYQKDAGSEDRPFKKSYGDKKEGGFKKPYDKERKPYQKDAGSEDRPFKKSYGDKKEGGFKKPYDKERKPYQKDAGSEDKPFRKSYGDKENSNVNTDKKEGFTPRKKRSFGKFDDDDLSFGKKKASDIEKPKRTEDEITFSKTLDKWEEKPVTPPYGKVEEKLNTKRSRNDEKPSRFRSHFDSENPHEKAYSNQSTGKPDSGKDYYDEAALEGEMPLNKFIAHCGICSRRDAVLIIKEGKVKVNDELITEPAHKVTTEDKITLSGKKISVQKNLLYILLNKPKGFLTTTDDPKGRKTVMDLFVNQIDQRIFPIGRLDRNTTGLLILTNDGELTQKLSHPKYEVKKVYQVSLDKDLSLEDFDKIKNGVILEDGPAPVDQLEFLDSKMEIGLEIHSGKNRIVRRIFESLNYEVVKLDRVIYAGLTKKNLMRGKWRFLSKQEVINLKHLH